MPINSENASLKPPVNFFRHPMRDGLTRKSAIDIAGGSQSAHIIKALIKFVNNQKMKNVYLVTLHL
jgi:hypothetical protein